MLRSSIFVNMKRILNILGLALFLSTAMVACQSSSDECCEDKDSKECVDKADCDHKEDCDDECKEKCESGEKNCCEKDEASTEEEAGATDTTQVAEDAQVVDHICGPECANDPNCKKDEHH